ncbi:MAG: hypothetical protein GY778_06585, partial [bacterium]|nr:hypothetical protein [bacterium]
MPILLIVGVCYWWFVQRIEVDAGEVLVLVHKVGQSLPAEADDQVVLSPDLLQRLGEEPGSTRYRGIVYQALPEGRYFYDPFFWERNIKEAVFIKQDEVGIKIRRFGKHLPPGKIVATEPGERGPLADVL